MKIPTTLLAALFAATAIVSPGAFAADTDKAPAAEAPAAKVSPHSHMQEKTGVAPTAKGGKDAAADEKAAAEKKAAKKRHLHPRDAK